MNLFIWAKNHLKSGGKIVVITPVTSLNKDFSIPGISADENELSNCLKLVFGEVSIRDVHITESGEIYTFLSSGSDSSD